MNHFETPIGGIMSNFKRVIDHAFVQSTVMFAVLMSSFLLYANPAEAETQLPQGHYTGQGKWYNDGNMLDYYTATLSIEDKKLLSDYADKFGTYQRQLELSGPFENLVLSLNQKALGSGYCIGNFCSFEWHENDAKVEEIWIFESDKNIRSAKGAGINKRTGIAKRNGVTDISTIKRKGQRLHQGRWVVWEDSLTQN